MKWPLRLVLVRHDVSQYNVLKDVKKEDPLYQNFLRVFNSDPSSDEARSLALGVSKKFALNISDANTPLVDEEARNAVETGKSLAHASDIPDVIFVSPYRRAKHTLDGIKKGWPALKDVKVYEDERVREQDHGIANLYNDWRVFHVLHPKQAALRKLMGPYWYRYPQGESVPDMRERNRSWLTTLTRDWNEKKVFVVTHHLNILATRANLGRWSAEDFVRADEEEKPINCGVTTYVGYPGQGANGRLLLESYNVKHY